MTDSYGFRIPLPGNRATKLYGPTLPSWDAPYGDLCEWVLDQYPHPKAKRTGAFGLSGVGKDGEDDHIGFGFKEFIERCLESIDFTGHYTRQWISILNSGTRREKSDTSWSFGFPHVHSWVDAVTFTHIIQEPEGGGEHVILPDGKEGREVVVKSTLGALTYVDGHTWHGVRPVTGAIERIALLATVYGPKEPMVCSS